MTACVSVELCVRHTISKTRVQAHGLTQTQTQTITIGLNIYNIYK